MSEVKCVYIDFADDDRLGICTSRFAVQFIFEDQPYLFDAGDGLLAISDYAEELALKNSPFEMQFDLDDAMIARIQADRYTNRPFKAWQVTTAPNGQISNIRLIKAGVLDTHKLTDKTISFIGSSHINETLQTPDGLTADALHKKKLREGAYNTATIDNTETVDDIFRDASRSFEGFTFSQFRQVSVPNNTKIKQFGNIITIYNTKITANEVPAKTISGKSTFAMNKIYGEGIAEYNLVGLFKPVSTNAIINAYRRDWDGRYSFTPAPQGSGAVASTRLATACYAIAHGPISSVSVGFKNINNIRFGSLRSFISPTAVDVVPTADSNWTENERTGYIGDGGRCYIVAGNSIHMIIEVHSGRYNATAPQRIIDMSPVTVAAAGSNPAIKYWTADHRGIGVAMVYITYFSSRDGNNENLWTSFPEPFFIVRDKTARGLTADYSNAVSADERNRFIFNQNRVFLLKSNIYLNPTTFEDFQRGRVVILRDVFAAFNTAYPAILPAATDAFNSVPPPTGSYSDYGRRAAAAAAVAAAAAAAGIDIIRIRDRTYDIYADYLISEFSPAYLSNDGTAITAWNINIGQMIHRSRSELSDDPNFNWQGYNFTFHRQLQIVDATISDRTEHMDLTASTVYVDYLTNRAYGPGLDDSAIDPASFFNAQNSIQTPSYLSGTVSSETNYSDALTSFGISSGLTLYEGEGKLKLYHSKTFSADDAFTFDLSNIVNIKLTRPNKTDRINELNLQYSRFVTEAGNETSISTEIYSLVDDDARTADNGRRIEKTIDCEFLTSYHRQDGNITHDVNTYGFAGEIEQYAQLLIAKNRLQQQVEITSNADINLRVGEVFAVEYPRWGWQGNNKAFFVAQKVVYKKDFSISVKGQMHSNDIFAN